jgi:hypothetical protein
MPYCPNCGEALGDTPARQLAEIEAAEVKIARINAERDIEVARIGASLGRQELQTEERVTEMETEVAPAVAAAEAAVLGAMLGAEGETEPESEGEPIIVDEAPDAVVVEDDAPPPAEAVEGSEPPEPAAKRGIGMWGG